jgi:hypothetical protein
MALSQTRSEQIHRTEVLRASCKFCDHVWYPFGKKEQAVPFSSEVKCPRCKSKQQARWIARKQGLVSDMFSFVSRIRDQRKMQWPEAKPAPSSEPPRKVQPPMAQAPQPSTVRVSEHSPSLESAHDVKKEVKAVPEVKQAKAAPDFPLDHKDTYNLTEAKIVSQLQKEREALKQIDSIIFALADDEQKTPDSADKEEPKSAERRARRDQKSNNEL